MKKVAATSGQSVRRTNFFRVGTAERGWEFWSCCRLAVANFYGCLLKRLTLTTASPLSLLRSFFEEDIFSRGSQVGCVFPGISAKLVRICEITGNFHRCKIFLRNFVKFCKREERYEGNTIGQNRCVSSAPKWRRYLGLVRLKQNRQPHVYNRTS